MIIRGGGGGGGGDSAVVVPSWCVSGDGRCAVRAIIYQLTLNGRTVRFGDLVSNPLTDYRTDNEFETRVFLGAAFRAFSQSNLEYVRSLPLSISASEWDGARRLVALYQNAHDNRNLYANTLRQELWASESILRGAAMLYDRPIHVRHDYRLGRGSKDDGAVAVDKPLFLDQSQRRDHDHGRVRVINSEASSNNALFLNNIIVNDRGLHFDLQHHPDRETSPDLSDGATVPTSTCTCNEANECLCSRDNVPTSSRSSQGQAAQAMRPRWPELDTHETRAKDTDAVRMTLLCI